MIDGDKPATLFLDTEWADDHGRELVSLALVPGGPYGLFTGVEVAPFYAERDPLPLANGYVRGIVYPLLDRGAFAKSDDECVFRSNWFSMLVDDVITRWQRIRSCRWSLDWQHEDR